METLQNHLFERPPVASFAQYVRKHLGQLQRALPRAAAPCRFWHSLYFSETTSDSSNSLVSYVLHLETWRDRPHQEHPIRSIPSN